MRRQTGNLLMLTYIYLGVAGCGPTRELGLEILSTELRGLITEVRVFAYDPTTDPTLRCALFDPAGAAPGDAEARTGRTAEFKTAGALAETVGEISGLPQRSMLLIVEAWERRVVDDASRSVLRAYQCLSLDLSDAEGSEVTLGLLPLVPIGSTMQVPSMISGERVDHYDADNPLFVTDGVRSAQSPTVQLLDPLAGSVTGAPVFFRILEGRATVSAAGTSTAAAVTNEQGAASLPITPADGASAAGGGKILIEASAAGYAGSPIVFEARALPSFDASMTTLDIPRTTIDLAQTEQEFRPILAGDLDADGHTDLVTAAGARSHRMAFLYGRADGGFDIEVSPERTRTVLAMTFANLEGPGATVPSVVTVASHPHSLGSSPVIDMWWNPGRRPEPGVAEWTVTSTAFGDWPAISVTARDLDGDELDELTVVRCERVFSKCWGTAFSLIENEIAVFKNLGDGALDEVNVLPAPPNRGGFRKTTYADLDRDGSLDLIAATQQWVHGYCGNRDRGDFGYTGDFTRNITLGQGWGVDVGQFNEDGLPDIVAIGGFRNAAPKAGLRLLPGCVGCVAAGGSICGFDEGPSAVLFGRRGSGYVFPLAVVDVNGDGRDDVVALHRSEHTIYTFLGAGNDVLAAGPRITLPISIAGELAVTTERVGDVERTFIATFGPEENKLVVLRLSPR